MRILWLTHVYPRDASDLQGLFLHRLARELPSRSMDVLVVAPSAPGASPRSRMDGIEIRRFRYAASGEETLAYTGEMHRAAMRHPRELVRFLRAMRREFREVRRHFQPDVVHVHWWFPAGLCYRMGRPAGDPVPLVLSLHGTDVRLLRRFLPAWPAAWWTLRGADRTLPVSGSILEELGRLHLPHPNPVVLPMPADAAAFFPSATPPSAVSFVVPARLVAQKRIDVAIRALDWVVREGTVASLEIVGQGEKLGELRSLVESLRMEDRVRFHGLVPQGRMAELVREARAVVLPSENEGYGLVLVEAGLCEKPSIGAESGSIAEWIEPERNGLLVGPGDYVGFGRAMRRLAQDADLAQRLGKEARRKALLRTAEPLADRLVEVYRDAASSRRNRIP